MLRDYGGRVPNDQKGLEALPAKLLWLRQAFGRFYRNDSKVFFRVEDGDEDVEEALRHMALLLGD